MDRKITEGKCLSLISSEVHALNMTHYCWSDFDMGWCPVGQVSPLDISSPTLILLSLEGIYCAQPTLKRGGELCSISLRAYINWNFLYGRLTYSSPFINLFNHLLNISMDS